MSTINEVIQRVDRIKPNALEEKDKARWLMELDGRTWREVTAADTPEAKPPEQWPEDGGKPLLVSAPYDNMYDLYLMAMIEFAQGEYSAYNNTVALFDQAQQEWRALYRREHLPKERFYRNVM
ncbi:MAG: hypothetical protein VB071_14670 [Lawsonibacter sp.]|nr:hypothetical protein [Lawsonibacter sp.]